MKKILMIFLCIFVFVGCNKNKVEKTDVGCNKDKDAKTNVGCNKDKDAKTDVDFNTTFDSSRFIKDIKEFTEDEKSKELIRAFSLVPIKVDEKDKEVDVFLCMRNSDFSYKDGIFNEESGSSMPLKLKYEKKDGDYKLINIIYPKDGSDYYPSVMEMAGNDLDAANKAMDLADKVTKEMNDSLCEDLLRAAKEKGLTGFTHKLEEIPLFESGVIYIKSGPNHIDGTVEVVKADEYLKAKENKNNLNWSHCDSIIYHEKTGIAIKSVIDYFGE